MTLFLQANLARKGRFHPERSGLAGFGAMAHNPVQLRAAGLLKSKPFQRPDLRQKPKKRKLREKRYA